MQPLQAQLQHLMHHGLLGECHPRHQLAVPLLLPLTRRLALLLLVRQQRVLQLLGRKARRQWMSGRCKTPSCMVSVRLTVGLNLPGANKAHRATATAQHACCSFKAKATVSSWQQPLPSRRILLFWWCRYHQRSGWHPDDDQLRRNSLPGGHWGEGDCIGWGGQGGHIDSLDRLAHNKSGSACQITILILGSNSYKSRCPEAVAITYLLGGLLTCDHIHKATPPVALRLHGP
jgi:hypothetical protein